MSGGLVPGSDVRVECLLGLAHVVAAGLQLLLAHLDLSALGLGERLALLLPLGRGKHQAALRAAHRLSEALRRE
ncbi:MAG: hypothetical protein GAK36_00345 [Pseudomonas sp.]|nr:MAG: hypothetical protein GAK36_00345 [Pseudomonas sp.]